MAGRINDEDIQALKARVDIVEVIQPYTALKRAGAGFVGRCPFHDESTPSFSVQPSKGFFHCLAGETEVLTWEGVRPLKELAGSTARVMTTGGVWVEAPFRSYGQQRLWAVHVSRNGVRKTLYATDGHRWLLRGAPRGRAEVTTAQLRPHDALAYAYSTSSAKAHPPSPIGVAAGFTFGDGTRDVLGSAKAVFHSPDEDLQLRPYFPERSRLKSTPSDSRPSIDGLPNAWRRLPDLDENAAYLFGWLAGYFAADGCVSADGQVILSSADRGALEHVRTVANRLGIGTYGIKTQMRTGDGTDPTALHHLTFISSSLRPDFFVLRHHRERYQAIPADRSARERKGWVVQAVEPTDRIEEVFCAEVPRTHAFVLADNILTGNCFGCSAGGDAIKFVQDIEGLSFTEAVEKLARQLGMPLRYQELRPGQKAALGRRTRLLELVDAAAAFYRAQLKGPDGGPARAYLEGRGIPAGAWEVFGLGWAPDAWSTLSDHLVRQGAAVDDLVAAGLSTQGKRGPVDRFRARVLFPIRDPRGSDVVAFGGRILPGGPVVTKVEGTAPKYINSPATEVYDKSTTLYGLDLARREVVKRREVVVVEGYVDVVALHLAGLPIAVAPCGTALTEQHFAALKRMDCRVTLALDADSAGFEAAARARERAAAAGVDDLGVLVLPDGQDPADLVAAGGLASVERALAARKTAVEFQIDHLLRTADLSTPEAKTAAYRSTFELLGRIEDPALRYHYVFQVVAPAVGLPAQRIEDELARAHPIGAGAPRTAPPPPRRTAAAAAPGGRDPQLQLERQVLQVALQHPELLPDDWGVIDESVFTTEPSRVLFRAVGAHRGDLDAVLEAMPDDDMRARVRGLAASELTVDTDPGQVARLVDALRGRDARRRWESARRLLAEGGEHLGAEDRRRLMRDAIELERVWRAFERRDVHLRGVG
jgi:DNA primase